GIRKLDLEPVNRIAVVHHGYGEVVWTSPATTSCAFHTGPCDNGCIAGDGQRSDAAAVVSKAVHVVVVLHRPAECTVRRSHYFESEPGGTVEDVDIAAASPLCGNRCITRCHGHRRRRGAVSCSIPSDDRESVGWIRRGRWVPRDGIRRSCILRSKICAIELEVNSGHSHVVGCISRYRDRA